MDTLQKQAKIQEKRAREAYRPDFLENCSDGGADHVVLELELRQVLRVSTAGKSIIVREFSNELQHLFHSEILRRLCLAVSANHGGTGVKL